MPLKPHEQRVVAELDQLRERLTSLRAFVESDTFVALHPDDRELLVMQEHLMATLAFVLARRIKRFADGVRANSETSDEAQQARNEGAQR